MVRGDSYAFTTWFDGLEHGYFLKIKKTRKTFPSTDSEGKENTQNTCPNLSKYLNYCCSMIVKKNISFTAAEAVVDIITWKQLYCMSQGYRDRAIKETLSGWALQKSCMMP